PALKDDGRVGLLKALAECGRPLLVAADPQAAESLPFADRLVDVCAQRGAAAAVAGAWAAAAPQLEERAGAPLAVALLGTADMLHAGLLGACDNATAGRDVLHIVVRKNGDRAAGIEALLRGAGLEVACVEGDQKLAETASAQVTRTGPRALVWGAG